jgi:hypothetical protein
MKDIYLAETASKVKRPLLEKDVQKACVDWYRKRSPGAWARKFSSQSQRSVPDYLFSSEKLFSGKIKFACEFKAPGKTSTDAQLDEQEAMRLAGWFVFECDNFDKFKATVLAYEQECV